MTGVSGERLAVGKTFPAPEPEDLNLIPDGRDPRPENTSQIINKNRAHISTNLPI
jgi:hypothetical protein